jgi:deoxyribodipyrimidine photo-lyase
VRAIYWVRNDLRLHDNPALCAFADGCREGFAIWCPTLSFFRAGPVRRRFILDSVQEIKAAFTEMGGEFIIAHDLSSRVLPSLVENHKIDAIYFSEEPTVEERREEVSLLSLPVSLTGFPSGQLIRREHLPCAIADIPEVFTRFRLLVEPTWKVEPPLPAPSRLPGWDGGPIGLLGPDRNGCFKDSMHPRIRAGERAGLLRVQEYIWQLDRLRVYKETRNGMMDWDDSSKFSPWLSIGCLSPRFVYAEIKRYEDVRVSNESTYWLVFELLWREYFRCIAEKWGGRLFHGVKRQPLPDQSSANARRNFVNWAAGTTGDAFVDANMRELNQTGWMSNRGRQNVASFLCHHLGVDWRRGAEYFESRLIDYDCSSNWGNWSYIAGSGLSPAARTFNTQRQAERYDPDGAYRAKWRD